MPRLKNRQMQIPGGMKYLQPETGFQARPFSSFQGICQALAAHRAANPHLAQKHKWAMDRVGIENDVENFNAAICVQMGWTDYLMAPPGEPPPPKMTAPSVADQRQVAAAGARVAKIWSGIRTINDWYDSKEPAVPAELSEARAKICSECPLNEPGDYTKWFVQPAAEAVRRQVEKFSERKLTTPYDDKLHTCRACLCVNKLSVHAPIAIKIAHLRDDVIDELRKAPNCWVLSEGGKR